MAKHQLYKVEHPDGAAEVLEEMRKKLAKNFGVTVNGNVLALRWHQGGKLVQMVAVITEVEDGADDYKCWDCGDTGDENHFSRPHCPKCKAKAPCIGLISEGCPQ